MLEEANEDDTPTEIVILAHMLRRLKSMPRTSGKYSTW